VGGWVRWGRVVRIKIEERGLLFSELRRRNGRRQLPGFDFF